MTDIWIDWRAKEYPRRERKPTKQINITTHKGPQMYRELDTKRCATLLDEPEVGEYITIYYDDGLQMSGYVVETTGKDILLSLDTGLFCYYDLPMRFDFQRFEPPANSIPFNRMLKSNDEKTITMYRVDPFKPVNERVEIVHEWIYVDE
jgi:hypothetical protein